MVAVLIATSRSSEFQSLGTAGQTAADSWGVLCSLLARELSPAHARLLAEPVLNSGRSETDWYADAEAAPQPLASVPPGRQQVARQELARLVGDVRALADRMRAGPSESERFLASMLLLALELPDERFIFVDGVHPLLAVWGHAKAGPAASSVQLTGTLRPANVPMPIVAPPKAPRPKSWLGVALSALGVALLLLAASGYVAARDPFGWYATTDAMCEVPTGAFGSLDRLHAEEARETGLRLQLAQLSADAGERRVRCPPIPAAAPSAPPVRPSADEQRARDRGAQRGKVTVILAWDDRNDLDLYVICPNGSSIFYSRRSACGGRLDVDANGDARTADITPVENVFFTAPAPGLYRVLVDPYAMRVATTSRFRLTIKQEGNPDRVIEGTANNLVHRVEVATFAVEAAP